MAREKFRIELGINLYAAPIPRTNPNLRLFPLQNALVDVTREEAKPAWYTQLSAEDTLSLRLVDITDLKSPVAEVSEFLPGSLNFWLTDRDEPARRANPFTEWTHNWRMSSTCERRESPVYSVRPGQKLPTWDIYGEDASGKIVEELTFAGVSQFKALELTMAIEVRHDTGWVDQYVFDPEMIVSETDGGP